MALNDFIATNERVLKSGNDMQTSTESNNSDLTNVSGISERTLYEYACKYDELIDWQRIRNHATEVAPWRTVDDLRRQWDHHLRPDVNHHTVRWTREENQKLNQLVEEAEAGGGGVDWHAIAKALGTCTSFNFTNW